MGKPGGFLIVGGIIVFYLFDYFFSGSFPRGPMFLIIALPGILFLSAGFKESLDKSNPDKKSEGR